MDQKSVKRFEDNVKNERKERINQVLNRTNYYSSMESFVRNESKNEIEFRVSQDVLDLLNSYSIEEIIEASENGYSWNSDEVTKNGKSIFVLRFEKCITFETFSFHEQTNRNAKFIVLFTLLFIWLFVCVPVFCINISSNPLYLENIGQKFSINIIYIIILIELFHRLFKNHKKPRVLANYSKVENLPLIDFDNAKDV